MEGVSARPKERKKARDGRECERKQERENKVKKIYSESIIPMTCICNGDTERTEPGSHSFDGL